MNLPGFRSVYRDERNDTVNFWATDQQGDYTKINISFTARISEQTTVSKMYVGWKEKKNLFVWHS